jgi:hypothetical protein
MRAVLADHQRLRFGQVEHLPGNVAGGHRVGQWLAICGAGWQIVVDDSVRRLSPAQRLAGIAGLSAWLLAGGLSQAAGVLRLLQSVARRRLATIAAVQPETALQLGNACLLRQQQRDKLVLRQLVERRAIHRLLAIGQPKSCQPKSCSGCVARPYASRTPDRGASFRRGQLGWGPGQLRFFSDGFVALIGYPRLKRTEPIAPVATAAR